MPDDDEMQAYRAEVRRMFQEGTDIPVDIVPSSWGGWTVEELRAASDRAGTWAEVTTPGELLLDADGIPNGFGPPTTSLVCRGGTAVTQSTIDRLGVDPEDFPGITVMPDFTPKKENRNE